eukprot:1620019-Pleurochrysis_carterae.AAC.1
MKTGFMSFETDVHAGRGVWNLLTGAKQQHMTNESGLVWSNTPGSFTWRRQWKLCSAAVPQRKRLVRSI